MQKYTIKLILRKDKKNKLGLNPIYVRITINRRSSFMATGYHIHHSLWDERNERVKDTHPLASSMNLDITNKKRAVLDDVIQESIKKANITAASIKEKSVQGKDRTNIFPFAERVSNELEGKRAGSTIKNWGWHLKKLEEFNGSRDLDFEQITKEYLTDFEVHLRKSVKRIAGKNPNNYIGIIMMTIRGIFNAALKEELITCYPFKYYEIPEMTPGKKQRLTLNELDRWEEFLRDTKVKRYREVGTWFLFGCYTGLRVSDWRNFNFDEDIHHNYISVEAIKNKERVALPIHSRLERTLKTVKGMNLMKSVSDLNKTLKEMCKELKIKKSLSSHSARHTFAITMCAERGISAETCAKLMGITVVVCVQNYYKVTTAKIRAETEAAWDGI
jgi:integrase/recombinase XerD